MKRFLPLAIVLAGLVISFLLLSAREGIGKKAESRESPLVNTLIARPVTYQHRIESHGTVEPGQRIDLVSEVRGRVVWVSPLFENGQRVAAGDELIRIDPLDYQVALAEAVSSIASAEFALAENKAVLKRAGVKEAEAKLEAAKWRHRQAVDDLKNTSIGSPFDAVIRSKTVDFGQYVTNGAVLMTLDGAGTAEIRVPLKGEEVAYLSCDGKSSSCAKAKIVSQLGEHLPIWSGHLARIEEMVDERTRMFNGVVEIDKSYELGKKSNMLVIGQFVRVEIEGKKQQGVFLIPRSAVHEDSYVFVVIEDSLQKRAIHIVRGSGDFAVVDDGIQEGDRIVTTRLNLMLEGMSVRSGVQ